MSSPFHWKRSLQRLTKPLNRRRQRPIHSQPLRCEPLEPRQLLATFVDGANCLFAGHSFFVPIATQFDRLATDNGFSAHEAAFVFSSGATGSPEMLWENGTKKAAIVDELDDGDVDLFGLTTAFGLGSSFEDYARWIDLALSYNPDTEFLIGVPWVPGGPNFASATEFAAANETIAQAQFETVELLRAAYPDATIHYIDYGLTASVMYDMFEKDQLPDIVGLTPDPANGVPPSDALFADPLLGHAGPMMTELSALSWMSILYGADIANLDYTDYESDVDSIVEEVLIYNQQFQPEPGVEPSAEILSAYLGAVDVRFPKALENVSGSPQAMGDEGMPLVMSVQVDASTLSPEDFAITTASGAVTTPTAVTLAPADESDELRTILLTGPLGSQADLPVNVEIVGSVLSLDGEELKGLTSGVTTNEEGPRLVMATLDPGETNSSGESTHARIQTTWQGGVTGRNGTEIGPKELRGIRIIDQNGDAHLPVGFEDVTDNDNHVVLLVPHGVNPQRVEVRAGTLYDPTNQPNPDTTVEVIGTADLEEEPERRLPDGLRGRLGVGFNHFHSPMQQRGDVVTNARSASFRHHSTALNETREQLSRPSPRWLGSDGFSARRGTMAPVVKGTTSLEPAHVDAVMESETFDRLSDAVFWPR